MCEKSTGVYHVVVGFDKPLRYHLDESAVDVLYLQAGSVHILIWKLVVSSDMLEVKNRVPFMESVWIVVAWISVLCLLLFIIAKLYQRIGELDEQ